jgi:5'(3')-deoxyribonucleotidase
MRWFFDMDGTLAELREDTGARYMEPGYFLGLRPYRSIVELVKTLMRNGHVVYVITTVHTIEAIREKESWLNRYLPELRPDRRIYTTPDRPKCAYVPGGVGESDVLIDDHTPNLMSWPGHANKAVNPLNHKKGVWKGPCINVNHASIIDVLDCVQR